MKFRIGILAIALMAYLGIANNAHAALTLYLADGTNSITCVDNTVGCDTLIGLTGALQNTSTLGIWSIVNNLGVSKPIFPATLPQMDDSFSVTSSGAGTITIVLADDGFTPNGSAFNFSIGGTIGPGTGGTVTSSYFISTSPQSISNSGGVITIGGSPQTLGTLGPFSGTGSYGANGSGTKTPSNPYTLIEKVVITHTGAGLTSGDSNVVNTPEPTSLALLGSSLLGIATLLRKKLHRT